MRGEGDHRPAKYYLFPLFIAFPAGLCLDPCAGLRCCRHPAFPSGRRCLLGAEAAPPCPCGASAVPGAPLVPATLPVPCQRGFEPGHCSCSARGTEARYRAAGTESSMLPQRVRGARGWNPLLRLAGAMHPCGVSRSCIYLRRLPPPPCPMPVPSPAAPDLSADIAGRNKAVRPSVCLPASSRAGRTTKPGLPGSKERPSEHHSPLCTAPGQAAAFLGTNQGPVCFLVVFKVTPVLGGPSWVQNVPTGPQVP